MSDIICLAINSKENCDEKLKIANEECQKCFTNMTREDCTLKPFMNEKKALAKELTCYHLAYALENNLERTGLDKDKLSVCASNDICTDIVLAGSQIEMMKEMTKNL